MTEDDNEADATTRRRHYRRNWAYNVAAVALGVLIGGWMLIGSVALVRGPSQTTEGGAQ